MKNTPPALSRFLAGSNERPLNRVPKEEQGNQSRNLKDYVEKDRGGIVFITQPTRKKNTRIYFILCSNESAIINYIIETWSKFSRQVL